MPKRPGRKSLAQTPAPKSEKIYGSSKNVKESATAKKAKNITLSKKTLDVLKDKLEEFKKENPNKKNINLADLKAVYRRGSGAYSSSHRPTITGGAPNSRAAWSYARVNKFLKKASGEKVKAAYVQDDDLMQDGGIIVSDNLKNEFKLYVTNFFREGRFRNQMHKEDIKLSNQLLKLGLIEKGSLFNLRTFYLDNTIENIDLAYQLINELNLQDTIGGEIIIRVYNKRNKHDVMAEGGRVWDDEDLLKRYKRGDSIGFSAIAHLKGQGLIKRADGTKRKSMAEGGLIAPNGKPSNLTPEQYKLVRTPEFKSWFGDWENDPKNASKVVDENGEPLMVYHGTSATYNIFKDSEKGTRGGLNEKFWSFTSNIKQAYIYAIDTQRYGKFSEPRIIPAFLNIREMPIYDNEGKFYREFSVWGGYKWVDIFQLQDWHSRGFNMGVEFKEVDGFCVKNTIEMEDVNLFENTNELIGDTFYVKNSNQIKLADGSNTTFDANNPDIRFKNGGKLQNMKEKKGDCYYVAGQFAMGGLSPYKIDFKGEPYIVHAEVKGQGKIEGLRYGHAWVEDDFFVYDYSNGREIVFPKELYYQIGDVNTKDKTKYQRYTFAEARKRMVETRQYGPWDIVTDFEEGGELDAGQDITCVNCGWQWNTLQSDVSDKYVCHKCGFDNTLFYGNELLTLSLEEMAEKNGVDVVILQNDLICSQDYDSILYKKGGHILKKPMSLEKIAEKHDVEMSYLEKQLQDGMKHELEHTKYKSVAQTIALHHLEERPDYYEKLDELELEEGGEIQEMEEIEEFVEETQEMEIVEFLKNEKEEAKIVLHSDSTRIFKAMICKAKIENAEKREVMTENAEEKNVWQEVKNIWESCMNDILEDKETKEYGKGGSTCGCGYMYSKGGLAYGNSHDKGGMPMVVKSTGQNIEIEGGESVINKRSMQMKDKVEFEGERMTPCEVASKINEMGGGVKFKCEDVAEIIAEDGNF